jgi:hypothetical protein
MNREYLIGKEEVGSQNQLDGSFDTHLLLDAVDALDNYRVIPTTALPGIICR